MLILLFICFYLVRLTLLMLSHETMMKVNYFICADLIYVLKNVRNFW